ncbi:uncharacterized protein EKO05_0005253 [Ascochyta rabiei]|uniref:Uncharacterized protein n=1 Tax=Didymella rabiei TaxID=5454 RepID=A0A163L4Z9_DIDRA|nr:uncharacterized protein EKO05_0005253 [Ascochyta rabiei]KZM27503.1 hypothetical protein ST47_g1374 [Ascochyta rabiei]UPX14781.1 hypothetical protein EKO05_0005253 [Ascochyta rabiei]
MPSLLLLPREIRDQIIEYVICFRVEPPRDPTDDAQSRKDATGQAALRPPTLSPRTYNTLGLLGTNIQLKAETENRLRRLNPTYTLDVMVVDNEIWPTWTCCPSRASDSIGTVHVSLRFFSKVNDPYVVHVARTCRAILQGRTWTSASLHPLAEIFLYIRNVCLQPDSKGVSRIRSVCFDASTADHFDRVSDLEPSESLSNAALKSLFGKHRSLWNSFRSIHQYPFAGKGEARRLELVSSLKIMVLLMLQEAWEDECATYTSYVGPIGSSFRSVQAVQFRVDGIVLEQLASSVLST